jgi:Zn-dependent protease with chaperone function
MGPNAFALPDGQIVLLDELIELLDDEEVLAVLAHEFGHVSHRHGIRQLIQSSVVAAVVTAWLGDISFIAASLGTVLLDSGYSREMEFDADRYAAEMLTHQGASPDFLAGALEKLETAHRGKTSTPDTEDGKGSKDWISTHPNTSERVRRLRKEPEDRR